MRKREAKLCREQLGGGGAVVMNCASEGRSLAVVGKEKNQDGDRLAVIRTRVKYRDGQHLLATRLAKLLHAYASESGERGRQASVRRQADCYRCRVL